MVWWGAPVNTQNVREWERVPDASLRLLYFWIEPEGVEGHPHQVHSTGSTKVVVPRCHHLYWIALLNTHPLLKGAGGCTHACMQLDRTGL